MGCNGFLFVAVAGGIFPCCSPCTRESSTMVLKGHFLRVQSVLMSLLRDNGTLKPLICKCITAGKFLPSQASCQGKVLVLLIQKNPFHSLKLLAVLFFYLFGAEGKCFTLRKGYSGPLLDDCNFIQKPL